MAYAFHGRAVSYDLDPDQIEQGQGALRPSLPDVIYLNAGAGQPLNPSLMWREISTAPFDRDLELAVLDGEGPHALVFPCRRIVAGWMNAGTRERIDVHPTHWREWHGRDIFNEAGVERRSEKRDGH